MSYGKARGVHRLVPYKFLWNVRVMSFTVNNQFLISLFAMCVHPFVLDDDPSLTTTALPLFYYNSSQVLMTRL